MKKVKVYGSSFWPGCPTVKEVLSQNEIEFEYVDITSGMKPLKEFLKLRDTLKLYEEIRGTGRVGIPMIAADDGDNTEYYLEVPSDLSVLKNKS